MGRVRESLWPAYQPQLYTLYRRTFEKFAGSISRISSHAVLYGLWLNTQRPLVLSDVVLDGFIEVNNARGREVSYTGHFP
jgi:hypothetical protein